MAAKAGGRPGGIYDCSIPRFREAILNTTTVSIPANLAELLAALAVGLIIGLERGWRDREMADGSRIAGLRTFALIGLLGGVFSVVNPWLLASGALGLALLSGVAYRESVRSAGNLSETSSVAQVLTYGLGALSGHGEPVLAVGASVLVAVLLNLRSTLHRWLRLIEHRELSAALQMLVLSAVVLPLLPDASYGPYGALNPYRLWWAVVLIAGLSLSGHVTIRMMGARQGIFWTGLLGGLASSTATTVSLARKAREHPSLLEPALAGALASCAMMFFRMSVVAFALAPALGRLIVLPMLLAGLALILCASRHRRTVGEEVREALPSEMRPFDLGTAVGFGIFLGLISVLTEAGKAWLGASGVYGVALLSGVADVDAITVSMSRMTASGGVMTWVAAVAVGLAALTNMVAKIVIAWTTGGRAFGRSVATSYLLAIAAASVATALLALLAG